MRRCAALLILASGLVLASAATALATETGMRFGLSRGPFSERYAPESLSLRVGSLERLHMGWGWVPAESTRTLLSLSRGAYAIADPDFPGTVHQRTETEGLLGGALAYPMLGGTLGLGVGYAVRWLEVSHTAKAPGTDPAFLFAPWQVFHGVAFLAEYRRGLIGPFGLALDVQAQPYGFAHMGDRRMTIPSFWSVSLYPRVTFWGDRAAIGYRYERTYNATYGREGGLLTASFALSGF